VKFIFFGPELGHLGPAVAWNHGKLPLFFWNGSLPYQNISGHKSFFSGSQRSAFSQKLAAKLALPVSRPNLEAD
jgi:hypothetical protein